MLLAERWREAHFPPTVAIDIEIIVSSTDHLKAKVQWRMATLITY